MNDLIQFIEQFLNHCAYHRNFSSHTIKAYRLDLLRFRLFLASRHPSGSIASITRLDLREFAHELACYKPRSQRRKLAAVKSLFGFLEREGFLDVNPARTLRLDIRVGRTLPRTIPMPALQRLFSNVYAKLDDARINSRISPRTLKDIALLELMFATGMRVSEASNLQKDAVDLERGSVMVLGKGNKERLIPICNPEVLDALKAYTALEDGREKHTGFFFTNRFGRRLSEQSIRMALRRLGKSVGLDQITPHFFRHTVATMLLEEGVDLRFIQNFLGHSSIVTTTIYAHVNDKSQRAVLSGRHPRRLLGN